MTITDTRQNTTHITPDELSADRSDYIDTLRAETIDHLTASLEDLTRASDALRELTSDHVYDEDLTETPEGADVLRHVETAACALRAARALVPTD